MDPQRFFMRCEQEWDFGLCGVVGLCGLAGGSVRGGGC